MKIIKVLTSSLLITLLFMVGGLVAAPFVVRQEQVVAFLEKNIKLPDGQKVKLEGNVDFGLVPYAYFSVPSIKIIGGGATKNFSDVKLGFSLEDVVGKSLDFDINAIYNNTHYKGNIDIKDFKSFYKNLQSPMELSFSKPLPFNLKGNFKSEGKKRNFSDFILTHKETNVTGNLQVETKKSGTNAISADIILNTKNIDDIRRLIDFKNYEDDFQLVEGKASLISSLSAEGKTTDEIISSLNSNGTINGDDIVIYGVDVDRILENPLEKPKFVKDQNIKTLFGKLDGNFNIENGILNLTKFEGGNEKQSINATGVSNLLKTTILFNGEISAFLKNSQFSANSTQINVTDGKVRVPFKVTGTFANAEFKIDKKTILNGFKAKISDKLINTIGEAVKSGDAKTIKDTLKETLKGLGGAGGLGDLLKNR